MIIVRNVFQAQLGKAHELVEDFKSFFEHAPMEGPMENRRLRLLTDLSGPFDTVVMEIEHESLAAAEALRPQLFSSPEFQDAVARTEHLLVSGHGQYLAVEAEFGR